MDDRTAVGADGPESPPEPAPADVIVGELVTETFEYDGGREVTVYVPRDRPEAVVFAGDGQLIVAMGRVPRSGRWSADDGRWCTPAG